MWRQSGAQDDIDRCDVLLEWLVSEIGLLMVIYRTSIPEA